MMRIFFSVFALITVLYSCKSRDKQDTVTERKTVIDSTLVTDSSWGPVTAMWNIDSLKSFYGDANIKDERICGPECADSIDVTFIYPETNKEVRVYWQDSLYHKKISFLETMHPEAPYHTATGLKTGSTLNQLLKVNGKPISFGGFGWDYGGYIQSFNGGTLDSSAIQFRLDLVSGDEDLLGEKPLNTDMPSVQKALDSIKVWQFSFRPSKDQ